MEPMRQLQAKVSYTQRVRLNEKRRLRGLLENGDLDETKRERVKKQLERLTDASNSVWHLYVQLMPMWAKAKIEYEKDVEIQKRDKEIQERDKRVSNLYGEKMELAEENKKLIERCVKAENHWWWVDWKPTAQDLEGLRREFDRCVADLKDMARRVRDWCRVTGVKPEGVNIEGIKNEDLIIWVANEYLWKKLPDGMREKICANKDHTMFSWENFKTTRKRLSKKLSKDQQYVNAPTRSKNDRHREGVPMAREVDGA